MDIASLADLLHETSERHGSFEAVAPPHNWWDWYAAYMDARERGTTPEEASASAGRYMAEVKGSSYRPLDACGPDCWVAGLVRTPSSGQRREIAASLTGRQPLARIPLDCASCDGRPSPTPLASRCSSSTARWISRSLMSSERRRRPRSSSRRGGASSLICRVSPSWTPVGWARWSEYGIHSSSWTRRSFSGVRRSR